MSYDVLTQRFVHEGGTKEYQLTSIRDDSTGTAYTIRRWGKVGSLKGNKVVRDDTRSDFHKEEGNRQSRGYKADSSGSYVPDKTRPLGTKRRSTGNWNGVGRAEMLRDWPEDWNLMQAKIGRGPSPEELQNVSVEEMTEHFKAGGSAKNFGDPWPPAAPPETTTEDNPMFGAF